MLQTNQPAPSRALRASEAVSHALKQKIAVVGEAAAVEFVGVSRPTLARLVGAMPVQHATLLLAAARLGVKLAGALADDEPADEGASRG